MIIHVIWEPTDVEYRRPAPQARWRAPDRPEAYPTFGFGGGSSRATTSCVNPWREWLPSQKGLFSECPQRQRPMLVRPLRLNVAPVGSQISKSPSMRRGPLLKQVILVAGIKGMIASRYAITGSRNRRQKLLSTEEVSPGFSKCGMLFDRAIRVYHQFGCRSANSGSAGNDA